uniref:MATH domain-containing protein n=1 Tax=Globodera pallida TaxID=36090 RepID=A0A183C139_GLOPA
MKQTIAQCLSNSRGNQAKDNKFKHQGQIAFRMPNLRPFSVGYGPNEVFSDPVEFINGFPWRIKIRRTIDDTYVGFYVDCGGESLQLFDPKNGFEKDQRSTNWRLKQGWN